MATIDLHIHTNYSNDADFSPTHLVSLCLEAGLSHAAIADHNSVKGIDEALSASEGTRLTILPAIEMDCELDGLNLHLLGYGMDYADPIFEEIEADLLQQERANSAKLMHLVHQLGIDFEDDVVMGMSVDGVVTGEMIGEAALLYDSQEKNPLLDPYRTGGERSDNPFVNFYWDFCSQGKPAYTPMDFPGLARGIEIIKSNGGCPVLAHPGINVKEDVTFFEKIVAEGIMGIEVFSSYHNPEQVRFYHQAATSANLLMTCGSDFHGKTKKSIKIGGIDCEGKEEEIITSLMDQIGKIK
jgi:predicted metal-dependent phosphoesterase TrpH